MEQILDKIIELQRNKKDLFEKSEYNIFSVLRIQSKEVLTCRMIADLLNPCGQHGVGSSYLELFLNDVLKLENLDKNEIRQARVTEEYLIKKDDRRIDIVIEFGNRFIPIEVKIYAGEQEAQCYDYYIYAKEKDSLSKIYYLTLDGHRPSSYSTNEKKNDASLVKNAIPEYDIVTISFVDNIIPWLEKCKTIDNPEVLPILNQFQATIESVCGYVSRRAARMIVNEIITSEESFRAGINVANSINLAKAEVMKLLFKELEEQIKPIVDKYGWKREKIVNWHEYQEMADKFLLKNWQKRK